MSCCGGDDLVVKESVKDYYGKVLKSTNDLQTNACTLGKSKMPRHVKEALQQVHDDVKNRYYGCGLVVPEHLDGMHILDLGSGSGQDCYVLSKLVGEKGHVTGIDMTEEQLEIARKYEEYHAQQFGYSHPNTAFVQGYIEALTAAGLHESSFDMIISNCVVNLSPDKRAVLTEAYKVLKQGGELYFSDVYADRNLPEEVRKHQVLWGECISGALWWKDLHNIADEVGFSQPRIVAANLFTLGNDELEAVVGDARFVSVTYRLFKLPVKMEDPCMVTYKGSIAGCEGEFKFDHRNTFPVNTPVPVSSELATIFKCSRFSEDFHFQPCAQDAACCGGQASAENVVDPFEFAQQNGNSGQGCCGSKSSKTDQGCCGPKSGSTDEGCCNTKSDNTDQGCCDSKSGDTDQGCCGPKSDNADQGCCGPKSGDTDQGCCGPNSSKTC